MQFRLNRRITAVVAAAVLGVSLAGGAAYAYWTAGGAGFGNVQQATTTKTLTVIPSFVGVLTPGGPAAAITGSVKNPNTFPVTIEKYSVAVANMGTGCSAADFTITGGDVTLNPSNFISVAADGLVGITGPTIALKETGANQDGCKNALINLVFTVN